MTISELKLKREADAVGTAGAVITLFPGAQAVDPDRDLTLAEFLEAVRAETYADQVSDIRKAGAKGDVERMGWLKRRLPAVTLSCSMTNRGKNAIERARTHSGWMQADFDGKNNLGLVQDEIRDALAADPHVGAVFVGPSGVGIKAVVKIDGSRHLESFHAAAAYFLTKYGLEIDKACKDIERLCFVSHDPEAWISEGQTAVLPIPKVAKGEQKTDSGGKREVSAPLPAEEMTMDDVREVLKWVPKRPDYETWLRVASGVFSAMPYDQALTVLNEWSPEEKPGEYKEKWKHRLEQVTIRTVIHLAQQRGFDAAAASRRKRWMGRIIFGNGQVEVPHFDLLGGDQRESLGPAKEVWECLEMQQVGDMELFVDRRGHDYAFDPLTKFWRVYNQASGIWETDLAGRTQLDIAATCKDSYLALANVVSTEIQQQPAKGKADSRLDDLDALRLRVQKLLSATYMGQVASLAQRKPQIVRPATCFDRARHLLAVRNGVLDFENTRIRPAERADMLSMASPATFEKDAACPAFDKFLERAFDGDAELISYWWRIVGYSLTGYVDHDALFFCYGLGANGKSTAFLVLRMLLGDDLSAVVNVQTLIGGGTDASADYRKSALEAKRLVLTDELPDSKKLNESMVKTLLGGEDIQARRPYQMPYNFSPTHKIWMVGNHKPKISGTDYGIWRRIHLIPWLVTIPPAERRPRHELLAVFRAELSGILNAALDGYQDFLERGRTIDPPKAVLVATEEYRQEEDTLSQFITDTLQPVSGAQVLTSEVWQKYREWCDRSGEEAKIQTLNKFTRAVQRAPYGLRVENGAHNCRVILDHAWH